MKNNFTLTLIAIFCSLASMAQIGIGTNSPNANAALDVVSNSQGMLFPRMTTTERDVIASPAKGLTIFNTTLNCIQTNVGTSAAVNWKCLGLSPSSNGTAIVSAYTCSTASAGTMTAGVAVSGVTQTITATVATVGTYSISATANGVTFAGSGTFAGTGAQAIVLTATGTPTAAGSNSFTLNSTPNCSFSRTTLTISETVLAQIGNEGDSPNTVTSVITVEQINTITPAITGAIAGNQTAYQAYIDANPSLFASPATVAEVQAMIDAVNASATVLAQIGTEGDSPNVITSVVTVAQINTITPAITGAIVGNQTAYQAYIDANPNLFASPATVAEVQAMINAVNASATVLAQIGNEGDSPNTVTSVITVEQINTITPAITGAIIGNQTAYQNYIDANPNSFSSPATAAEVQAMVNANLLDLFPGARTAVSLRKLRSAYNGNCIRVRRSSDSATLDIGFVNNILDISTLTTFVGSGSGFISIWYDQSGNGLNFIQNTSANQPAIIISGVLQTVNGKPAVNIDTSSKNLQVNFPAPYVRKITNTFDVTRTSDTNFVLYHGGSSSFAFVAASTQGSTNTLVNGDAVSQIYKNNVLQTLPLTRGASYNIISTNTQILLSYVMSLGGWNILSFSGYSGFEFVGFKQEFIMYEQQTSNISAINSNINNFYSIY